MVPAAAELTSGILLIRAESRHETLKGARDAHARTSTRQIWKIVAHIQSHFETPQIGRGAQSQPTPVALLSGARGRSAAHALTTATLTLEGTRHLLQGLISCPGAGQRDVGAHDDRRLG